LFYYYVYVIFAITIHKHFLALGETKGFSPQRPERQVKETKSDICAGILLA
jgi:hypothetical protein